MNWNPIPPSIEAHIIDICKAIIGVMITSAVIAGLQYIGTNIPIWIHLLTQTGGGVAAIKLLSGDANS